MADEITNCSVFFEYYGIEGCQPRLLPCTHTACESCLQMLLRENSVICPQCRKKHNADSGIRTFPLNKYIISQFEDSLSTEKLNEKIDKLRLYFRQCRDNLLSTKKSVDTKYVDYLVQVKNFKDECTRMFDHLVEETEQNRTNFDQTVDEKVSLVETNLANLNSIPSKANLKATKKMVADVENIEKHTISILREEIKYSQYMSADTSELKIFKKHVDGKFGRIRTTNTCMCITGRRISSFDTHSGKKNK